MKMEYVTPPQTKVPVIAKADVVVVGGGPAGVGAAVRAARHGADTVLIERFGSPGGITCNGFMFITGKGDGVAAEIMDRLPEGYRADVFEVFPEIFTSRLTHYGVGPPGISRPQEPLPKLVFDPDMTSWIMTSVLNECGVKILFRSLFVNTIVEGGTIKAVIVENASGKQAIEGKVFVDATGCGDVVARAGCPFKSPGDERGEYFMPPGLLWKMSDVDVQKVFDYEKNEDPGLDIITGKAKARGELPYYIPRRTAEEMHAHGTSYGGWHTGHPRLEFMPGVHPGDVLMWAPASYDRGLLNVAEKAEDLTRAEIQIREEIMSEIPFLNKYVPGFEKAHLSGIAPMMGKREGRHPIGEYVLTFEDLKSTGKFDDVVLRQRGRTPLTRGEGPQMPSIEIELPYRSFLAKKVDNLLLSGDNFSMTFSVAHCIKGFGVAMSTGEVAGTAAALSVKNKVKPKELKMEPLEVDIRYHHTK